MCVSYIFSGTIWYYYVYNALMNTLSYVVISSPVHMPCVYLLQLQYYSFVDLTHSLLARSLMKSQVCEHLSLSPDLFRK